MSKCSWKKRGKRSRRWKKKTSRWPYLSLQLLLLLILLSICSFRYYFLYYTLSNYISCLLFFHSAKNNKIFPTELWTKSQLPTCFFFHSSHVCLALNQPEWPMLCYCLLLHLIQFKKQFYPHYICLLLKSYIYEAAKRNGESRVFIVFCLTIIIITGNNIF